MLATAMPDTPAATAEKLVAYLHRADYGQQTLADIREA